MIEKMNEALEELKRVDHLIYVSLKYTRTVDVILNILNRMVEAYSLMVDVMLMYATEKGKSFPEPESAIERTTLVRSMFGSDEQVVDNMDLYLLLRKLLRARSVVRENEYRRHVTMKTIVEGREEIVNIDIITNYYLFQRDFLLHVRMIIDDKTPIELHDPTLEASAAPAWMGEGKGEEEGSSDREEQVVVHRTPPKRATIKVRPVGAPPRKRAPRPKKYKIQIPKGKNSITLPYEYDPHFRKEMEKEKARLKAEEAKNVPKKKQVKKAPAAKKQAKKEPKKKPVKKSPAKKPVKKPASILKRLTKAVRKATKRK